MYCQLLETDARPTAVVMQQRVKVNVNFKLQTHDATMKMWRARNKNDALRLAFAGSDMKALCRATGGTFAALDDRNCAPGTPLAVWHAMRRKMVQRLSAIHYKKACLSLRTAFKKIPKYLRVMQEQAALAIDEADAVVCGEDGVGCDVWTCALTKKPAPSMLGMVWEERNAPDAVAEANLLVLGKAWRGVDGGPPPDCVRFDCPALEAVVRGRRNVLTHAEWHAFGLGFLQGKEYLLVDSTVYVPVDYAPLAAKLLTATRFSHKEWHACMVPGLQATDIVASGGRYFQPAPAAMLFMDGGIYTRPALRAYVAEHGHTPNLFKCTIADVDDAVFCAPSLQSLVCCITTAVTRNPIVTRDGKVYDREALVKWIGDGKAVSPLNPSFGLSLTDVKRAPCPVALLATLDEAVGKQLRGWG